MSNAEQTLRLLRELERLDRAGKAAHADSLAEENEPNIYPSPESDIKAAALFEALVANDFNLTAAILDVRRGT